MTTVRLAPSGENIPMNTTTATNNNSSVTASQGVEPELTPSNEDNSHVHHRTRRSRSNHRQERGHKAEQSVQSVQLIGPRSRDRRMSSTELFYPDPISAQEAFAAERQRQRSTTLQQRAPTPHSQRNRHRRSDSVASHRSNNSVRSRRSVRTMHDSDDEETVLAEEPHFGASRGIGPAGEAIEVIGLGRKEPRHRKYSSNLLKFALRSAASRDRVPILDANSTQRRDGEVPQNKPLPTRPRSIVVPINEGPSMNPSYAQVYHSGDPPMQPQTQHTRHASVPMGGLRSLFSSLSLDAPSHSASRPGLGRRGSSRRRELIHPADDLFTYLRMVDIPQWTTWPGDKDVRKSTASLGFFGNRLKGFDAMPWAWHRRMELAESARQSRFLVAWESVGRHWEKRICEWLDDIVPTGAIESENRWGSQIFALPADGYDTLEFFDEAADEADDFGLLSWLTGSVLQTAVSALHMLRYSSQEFTFHLIPSATPSPYPTSNHALWDGFGTLALVNKSDELDRAMVIEVRPPSIVDSSVMREFAKAGRAEGWWQLPGQYCVGDVGQANLLQAQVYDSCVQNQVYFFVVTNLKYWVCGSFNSNYTKCYCGPVVERKQRDPGLMQCLTAWVIRAVDERPRRNDQQPHRGQTEHPSRRPSRSNREDILVYPDTQQPSHSHSHSRRAAHEPHQYSLVPPQPYPQPGYNPSVSNFNAYPHQPSAPHIGEFGHGHGQAGGLPGYYDLHTQMNSPPPPFPGLPNGMGYGSWSGVPQRGFSPAQVQNGYGGGGGWYQGGFGWPMG